MVRLKPKKRDLYCGCLKATAIFQRVMRPRAGMDFQRAKVVFLTINHPLPHVVLTRTATGVLCVPETFEASRVRGLMAKSFGIGSEHLPSEHTFPIHIGSCLPCTGVRPRDQAGSYKKEPGH